MQGFLTRSRVEKSAEFFEGVLHVPDKIKGRGFFNCGQYKSLVLMRDRHHGLSRFRIEPKCNRVEVDVATTGVHVLEVRQPLADNAGKACLFVALAHRGSIRTFPWLDGSPGDVPLPAEISTLTAFQEQEATVDLDKPVSYETLCCHYDLSDDGSVFGLPAGRVMPHAAAGVGLSRADAGLGFAFQHQLLGTRTEHFQLPSVHKQLPESLGHTAVSVAAGLTRKWWSIAAVTSSGGAEPSMVISSEASSS
jgi:hypothetical protein